MEITTKISDGHTYYYMSSRGTDYTLRQHKGQWELTSKRQGFSGFPGFRTFATLADLEKQIKAFAGISQLVDTCPGCGDSFIETRNQTICTPCVKETPDDDSAGWGDAPRHGYDY